MKLKEKKISRKTIYQGPIFDIYRDEVLLPNDKIANRDILQHYGGVAIAARTDDDHYLLVQQYRYPQDKIMIEFTAGKKEKDEDPLTCAQRELIEETGYQAERYTYMGSFVPTCGYSTEVIYLYLAENLSFVGQNLDDNEFLNVMHIKLDDIIEMIINNQIDDAKTIILAFKLKYLNK
ncbi:MAG: NUDIX hydrolase [Erysipelotrichaceae bacterium]|nr:NUDIX hydrolase [Erysipelotrichaceae bacterium]